MTDFDPWYDIPENDEQAIIALRRPLDAQQPADELLTANLRLLYKLYRAQDHSVLSAFEKTLLTHIEVSEEAQRENAND